jgi:peptide chain release factor 1
VTDHRIGFTSHNIDAILDGDLEELTEALHTADIEERLEGGEA